MTTTVVSLRKLGRIAPTLKAEVLVTHGDRVIGTFIPHADRDLTAQAATESRAAAAPAPKRERPR